ncbi:MAG: autotransporter-associated beta strand repeat-containing protein [Rhodanobacter sp.]
MSDNKQGLRPCAMAFSVALALGLSGCGGGGGSNVRPSQPPPPPTTGTGDFAGGDVNVGSGNTLVWPKEISGSIDLIKGGAGTLVLTGNESYTDGTTINEGTLQIGNGGTTGSITGDVVDNAFLVFDRSDDVTFNGIVSGTGSLKQAGKGTLTLTGANTYTGGTMIGNGTLQLGNGGTTGSIAGDVVDKSFLVFNRSDNVTFSGIVSGSGSLGQAGKGTLTLTGANTYTGGTMINHGTLQIGNGGTTGSIVGNVIDNGTLAFDRSDDRAFGGKITGAGGLTKAGNGALTLTVANSYAGITRINAGSLYVDGNQSAATGTTTVANGATLGGKGILGGDVTVADGATLAPGSIGAIGTLTIKGDLDLSAGSKLDYSFGQANLAGGQLNDLINVNGNLVLDGTLNVSVASGGTLGPGVYRVFNYAGKLTDNGLTLGNVPPSSLMVQTSVAQQVNLVNTQGMVFSVWDGDAGPKRNNVVNGGSGTWESGNSLTINNWSDASGAINAPFSDRSFAVFQAAPGTVTVDDSNGDVNAAGMQFASDGYSVQGDTIHLVGSTDDPTHSIIRVGDGTTAGAGYKATIGSVLAGDSMLVKTDAGTLVLGADNSYTGGTTINGGTLQLGTGGTSGSITGDVTDNGSLVFERSDDVTFGDSISGSGSLQHAGTGRLILTGANTYSGGTTISNGALQIGNGGHSGSITGDVKDNGSFVFDQSNVHTFGGTVIGTGSLEQGGAGTLILTGSNTYTGGTTISNGKLQIGSGGITGSITGDVANNGFLVFGHRNDVTFNGSVSGTGSLEQAGKGKLTLAGASAYKGGTLISDGSLEIGNGGSTGSISGDVTDNSALVFNRSDDVTFEGIVSGSGSLTQTGAGRLSLTGASTYAGGTRVTGGTLEIRPGATLGTGTITVGNDKGSYDSKYTLQVDSGVSLSNRIALAGYGTLDNAGVLGGNVDVGVSGQDSKFVWSPTVLNHDGGSIRGNDAGVMLNGYSSTVKNSSGGTIEGGNIGVELVYGGLVSNDGVGSTIRSTGGIAVQTFFEVSGVENTGGGLITGGAAAVDLHYGGVVLNDGADSTISSAGAIAIQVTGESGTVKNTGGATITGASMALYLQHGGSVINDIGSTIETTGTASGDCGGTGDCAIFVDSDSDTPSNLSGKLTLTNAGTIVGNVQLMPTAFNSVSLSAGSSIQGDLEIGSNHGASLTLNGDAGTMQLYSHAVTGTTIFAGDLAKTGDGTWIIDNNDLMPDSTTINGGTLQIGNGGTEGSIELTAVSIYHGTLVFDRSDDVTFEGSISGGNSEAYNSTLVQAGTGTLTVLPVNGISPQTIVIERGTLQVDNTGGMTGCGICSTYFGSRVVNDGSLVFNSYYSLYGGLISGTGSVTLNGLAEVIFPGKNTYSGGTKINNGTLLTVDALPGNVDVNEAGALDGYSGATLHSGVPGVEGNLSNAGKVFVRLSDSLVGGNYNQDSTGTLAVSLGSKLDVTGTAMLNGGTLEVTGADSGYVSSAHTNVLTAGAGVAGTFDQLVKDSGVVFTATTINYDANSVWLDTTGLNVTTAAAGNGVSYTAASMGSAKRVQGSFEQLNDKIASGNLAGVSGDFLHAAGQFQQVPTLQAAQASLQSLSGQLHAVSAAMTFKAIDASSRALSERFDNLLGKETSYGMWTQNLSVGGDMARAGFDSVGFQLDGWLVGSDRQIGRSGVAGFAFGQSQGQQRLNGSFDHDHSRSTEGMLYAGGLNGNWYTQGRVGFGHFQQDVRRQLLLGESVQGVGAQYNGNYDVAYGETGLHFGRGNRHLTPYVNVQYARIDRNGFAEQGAGGFGLRSNAQTLDRWQAGLGLRAGHHWELKGGRAMDFSARAQWQQTLAEHGEVFDASFVGLQQWQPLVGIGLSRYCGLFGVGLDATLSAHASLKFSYDYEMGQRDTAQTLSARLIMAF